MAKNPITCGGSDIDANKLRVVMKKNNQLTLEAIGGVMVDNNETILCV